MPGTSIPSAANAAELVAPSIVEYRVHIRERGWAKAAVGQFLEAVGEPLHQEAPVIRGRLGAKARALPRL